jgi:hypothetical protein
MLRFEREVGDDRHVRDADRTQRAWISAEPFLDFIGTRGTHFHRSSRRLREFRFAQLVIAAKQRKHGFSIRYHDETFHLRGFREPGEIGDLRDGLAAGCVELFGRGFSIGIVNARRCRI